MKRSIVLVMSIMTVIAMLSGCAAGTGNSSISQGNKGTTIFGQITAVDGSSITIAVGAQPDLPKMQPPQQGDADATTSATKGEDGQAGGPPNGSQDGPPSGDTFKGDGNAPNGVAGGPGGLTFTGEEQTVTVTDSTEITIQSGRDTKTGSLADLKTGDIVSVSVSDGKVTGITVMQMGMMGGAQGPGQGNSPDGQSSGKSDSTNKADSTSNANSAA